MKGCNRLRNFGYSSIGSYTEKNLFIKIGGLSFEVRV